MTHPAEYLDAIDGARVAIETATTPRNSRTRSIGDEETRTNEESKEVSSLLSINSSPRWPEPLGAAAFHGPLGEYVKTLEPDSEGDPAAILVQALVVAGNFIDRKPYHPVGGDWHYTNENVLVLGATSDGRKGSAWSQALRPFRIVVPEFVARHVQSGLSSGEGLIWAVRDPVEKHEPVRGDDGKATGEYRTVVADTGVDDKRLVVFEAEFASTLRVMQRDGNTLSAIVRTAFETGRLNTLTKNTPARATDAHISIVAHCTPQELQRYLDRTEVANGLVNRFMIVCARRSRFLPDGGNLTDADLEPIAEKIMTAIYWANNCGEISRDDEARTLWHEKYQELSTGKEGLLGAATSRATAHVLRLSMIYALMDRSTVIRRVHLEAALEVWRYVEDSAAFVFTDRLGDPVADALYTALKKAGADGLALTELHKVLGNNYSKHKLRDALASLESSGKAHFQKEPTGGRPAERWVLGTKKEESSKDGAP